MKLIDRFFRKCWALTPYELRRKQKEDGLAAATFETIKLALAYLLASKPQPTFVQVGACDGISGDPAHEFIRQGRMKALLVEPITQSFLKLRKTYDGVPNVTAVNAAIGTQDGKIVMFRMKESGTSIDAYWGTQLASFDRAHLLSHGVAERDIEAVSVPCLTLETLLAGHSMERLDLLQIDTEGFDAEVVSMALDLSVPPEAISFERVHLGAPKLAHVFGRLKEKGYVWTHDEWDTLAIREEFTRSWSREHRGATPPGH